MWADERRNPSSAENSGLKAEAKLMSQPQANPGPGGPRIFATTHWSVVQKAKDGDSEPARHALETLCAAYWFPIYVYVRRKGYPPHDAQDLTQEFFAQLIAKGTLQAADRERGKFRSFLLGTLDHFVAREWTRAHRLKRGGHLEFISWDVQQPEDRYRQEPESGASPGASELAVSSRRHIEFWDTTTWRKTREIQNFMDYLAGPKSGSMWLVSDFSSAGLYDPKSLDPLLPLPRGTIPLAISPDERWLAVSVDGRRLQVLNLPEVRRCLAELGLDWPNP